MSGKIYTHTDTHAYSAPARHQNILYGHYVIFAEKQKLAPIETRESVDCARARERDSQMANVSTCI